MRGACAGLFPGVWILSACSARAVVSEPLPPPVIQVSPSPEEVDATEPPPGVFHQVRRGQTLYTIARTYGVPLETIVQANGLADPSRIEAGALLFIPQATAPMDVAITLPQLPDQAGERFLRPVTGPVNSAFGLRRNGRMHYGLDFGAAPGTDVCAARDGVVLYAGSGYQGYGRLIIIEHGDGYQTLYAHNRKLLAREGETVHAGEVIAQVGATGNATGPHLHFEVRRNQQAVDPEPFLEPNEKAHSLRAGS
jgi:murein DD-endopeptidase MepM/ murein hydrolase activator NlpD